MVFGKVLTQKTAKAGIRLYGEEAVQALMQEFAQLEDLVFSLRRVQMN